MRLRACIALLLYVSACATSAPSRKEPAARDPRIANLQRAATLPWRDGGRCAVQEASEPWLVLAERCFHALDHDRLEFRDPTGRCAVASTGAAALGLGVEISRQTRHPVRKPGVPPRGLPPLKLSEDMPSPEFPHCPGWLNYWSAAGGRAIGFPDPARDSELLSRSRRTTTGGWVVKLTDEPLDLDNPAHLDALKRAYERFPELGGRSIS